MADAAVRVMRLSGEQADLARQATRINDEGDGDFDPAAMAEFLADRDCFLIVAVENGVVVGTLDGYALRQPHTRRPQFLLYEIDVVPECRRRGIGRALVDAFAAEARRLDADVIWVLTHRSNAAAVALYRSSGFAPDEQSDTMMMELTP